MKKKRTNVLFAWMNSMFKNKKYYAALMYFIRIVLNPLKGYKNKEVIIGHVLFAGRKIMISKILRVVK